MYTCTNSVLPTLFSWCLFSFRSISILQDFTRRWLCGNDCMKLFILVACLARFLFSNLAICLTKGTLIPCLIAICQPLHLFLRPCKYNSNIEGPELVSSHIEVNIVCKGTQNYSITLTNCCYFSRIDVSPNSHFTILLKLQAVRLWVSDLAGIYNTNSTYCCSAAVLSVSSASLS